MGNALLIAFAYLLWQVADNWAGWQTFTRPIVLCTLTGLMCGDIKTGVILGAELEAVYMVYLQLVEKHHLTIKQLLCCVLGSLFYLEQLKK